MVDSDTPQIYRTSCLDDIEDVEKYRPGGYHPVNLYNILDDRYKVVHKLGHGGFATIWLARLLKENRYVALKILVANAFNKDLKFLTYLRNHGVNHPTIGSAQDTFIIRGPNGLHQCLVFGFLGPSLKRITERQHQLSEFMVRNAARQIAEGLTYLHCTGICHGGKIFLMSVDVRRERR